ncbi:MAG: pyridoxine 5'-phosphate synthase [Gammaproteobacteria bacterium]|nr:pyridoxine 5'-phosphate synthase [Gammaproteobacteria bacterium]
MIELSVNVNKIAWLRNARAGARPSVLQATRAVIDAGAYGVTVHPRPDQRHITPGDVTDIADLLAVDFPATEFNIEGNPLAGPRANGYPGFDWLIERTRPHQCTLVPDTDGQITSDHGWDLRGDIGELRDKIARYQQSGARVSLFMDTDCAQIDRAAAVGADRIELYTGPFADTVRASGVGSSDAAASLASYRQAAQHAVNVGLGVNAGHDLDLVNLPLFVQIPEISEVSIGHALICDALDMGLVRAVGAYLDILQSNSTRGSP